MKRAVALVPVSLAAAAFLACGENPVERNGDPRLTLSADSVTLPVGASTSVTAAVLNTSEPAQFVSRDKSVATVNANGAISGVAVGSTYVVVTLSNHADVRDSVRVRVQAPDSCAVARPAFGGVATQADRDLFAYDANAPLNLQKTLESTNNGVEVSAISFSSPDGGSATGLLFDPVSRSGLRPGIVLMHGLPGNAAVMAAQAQLLADLGAVVIAIDAPFARRIGPPVRFSTGDRAEQIQLIKDLQRAVDVLRARANVDSGRIAYVGISYGAAMGALFIGIERRVKAAALVVGDGGLVSHYTGPEDFNFMADLSCATRVNWFRAMAPIEPLRFLPHAPPAALLLQSGQSDTLVPAADAQALHAAAPQPRTILWYNAGHGLNLQATFDRLDWLHEKIGLDARK